MPAKEITVVGRGRKSLSGDPGSELRPGNEGENKGEKQNWDGKHVNKKTQRRPMNVRSAAILIATSHLKVVERPHEVGPQALRRFVGDLDAVLENRHRKAGTRARGQPQPAEKQ